MRHEHRSSRDNGKYERIYIYIGVRTMYIVSDDRYNLV